MVVFLAPQNGDFFGCRRLGSTLSHYPQFMGLKTGPDDGPSRGVSENDGSGSQIIEVTNFCLINMID